MPTSRIPEHIDASLLELYLNDHLAGAAAGRGRIANMTRQHADLPISDGLRTLRDEISEEYDRVAALIGELGLRRLRYRQMATAVGEVVGRSKLNRRITGRSPMTPLLELELIRGAVSAKQGLWDLLSAIAPELGLDAAEFERRSDNVNHQLSLLVDMHAQLAPGTFERHPASTSA